MSSSIKIKVYRTTDADTYWKEYEIAFRQGMSALDALEEIRKTKDPTLTFSYSCRHGKTCRLCLAEINGKNDYLCSVTVSDGMRIKPLSRKTVYRDLMTEL